MTTPRNYQTEAIIIRKTKLGEADSILTLYKPRLGKIQGFAKSLRKPKSRLAGHLELLTYSQVSLARGRSIDTITGSQTINSFLPLKTDLDLASYALYVIELVNQFTPEHAPPLLKMDRRTKAFLVLVVALAAALIVLLPKQALAELSLNTGVGLVCFAVFSRFSADL